MGPDAEIHVLLAPTPPADYVNDFQRVEGTAGCTLCWKNPIPCYGYEYAITTTDFGDPTPEAPQKHGVVEFVDATDAQWFDPVCTCTAVETRVLFENGGWYASTDSCIDPVFGAIDSPPPPTPAPTLTRYPTPSPTEDQGDEDEGGGDIQDGEDDPSPTPAPTCVDSESWYQKKPSKNCDWLEMKNEKKDWIKKKVKRNCKRKDADGKKAQEECACHACDFDRIGGTSIPEASVAIIVPCVIGGVLLLAGIAGLMLRRFKQRNQQ